VAPIAGIDWHGGGSAGTHDSEQADDSFERLLGDEADAHLRSDAEPAQVSPQ
jgi:hypothetical protein